MTYKRPQTARLRGQSTAVPANPDERLAPRLYLAVPQLAGGRADALAPALAATDVAAVLLGLPHEDERSLITAIKAFAPAVQGRGTALVLDRRADLVARAGADGAHLSGIEALTAALPSLKPERIAGCGGLHSRHDAMLAAEAGADYVMFGEPDANGRRPSLEAVVERVVWWAEVFEIPCVGYAGALDEIAPLARAGADFVAVGAFILDDPRGAAVAMADAAQRLAMPEAVG
jgi:thiamine-phosphate pyrophosphorylase